MLPIESRFVPEILELDFCAPDITDKIAGIFETQRQKQDNFEVDKSTLEKEYPRLKKSLYFAISEFDSEIEEFHNLMRIYGATEAQITWGLYNNIRLRSRDQENCDILLDHISTINKTIIISLGTIKFFSMYIEIPDEDIKNFTSIEKKYRYTEKYHDIMKKLNRNKWS